MKNLRYIFLIIITLVVSADASNSKPRPNLVNKKRCIVLEKAVKQMMHYSDFSEQIQGAVIVKYYVDQNSTINIKEIQSNDERLKEYVYLKLNGKEVCNNLDANDHLMKIDFLIR